MRRLRGLAIDAVYLLVVALLVPVVLARRLVLALRRRRPKARAPVRARLGGFPVSAPGTAPVWIHGVSVGEVLAARTLVRLLEESGRPVVVSTTTRAGLEVARREYPGRAVFHAPLDFSFAQRRAFDAVRPRALVLMELELWPNQLLEADARGVPVVLANGRISPRSLRGYRRLLRILPGLLQPIRLFCLRDAEHDRRWAGLGVPASRRVVTGNMKVDNLPAAADPAMGSALRRELGLEGRTVWLAGSTHEGEDEIVIRVHLRLRERRPDLVLVLVPRHLERVDAVLNLAAREGASATRRSAGTRVRAADAILLVDTMGELRRLFSVADVVFLGGSLVPVGGHNLLEPAAERKPVVYGPAVWTVEEEATELERDGGAVRVGSGDELERVVGDLLDDESRRARAGAAARAMVDRHRGASRRTAEALLDLLEGDDAEVAARSAERSAR